MSYFPAALCAGSSLPLWTLVVAAPSDAAVVGGAVLGTVTLALALMLALEERARRHAADAKVEQSRTHDLSLRQLDRSGEVHAPRRSVR